MTLPAIPIITFRMSSAGYCPKRLALMHLGKTGLPEPEWLKTTAKEGQKHEEWLIEELRVEENYFIHSRQMEIGLHLSPTVKLVGHWEGIACKDSMHPRVLEIKTMSEFEYARWIRGRFDEFPAYADQHTCYLEFAYRHLPTVVGGHYLVKNRNSGATDTIFLDRPPSSFAAISTRLLRLAECIRGGEVPQVDYNPDSWECRRCAYRTNCIHDLTLTPAAEAVLTVAADQWRRGKSLEKQSKELQDNAKRIFAEHSEATDNFNWRFRQLIIRKQNGRTSIDRKKLLEAGIPQEVIDSASNTGDPFYRITDTRKSTDEEE